MYCPPLNSTCYFLKCIYFPQLCRWHATLHPRWTINQSINGWVYMFLPEAHHACNFCCWDIFTVRKMLLAGANVFLLSPKLIASANKIGGGFHLLSKVLRQHEWNLQPDGCWKFVFWIMCVHVISFVSTLSMATVFIASLSLLISLQRLLNGLNFGGLGTGWGGPNTFLRIGIQTFAFKGAVGPRSSYLFIN